MNDEENFARRHRFGGGSDPSALLPARLMCVVSLLLLVAIFAIGRAA